MERQVAACPQSGGLLHGAVAEEAGQNLFHTGNPQDFFQGKGLRFRLVSRGIHDLGALLPEWQAENEHHGQHQLNHGDGVQKEEQSLLIHNGAVACVPCAAAGHDIAHDVRAGGGAHAPHAVQPAHVLALVVQRHVVIQGSVHASRAQPVGNRPQAELPEGIADGKSPQRHGGHGHADGRDLPRTQPPGQPVALQAGNDGSQRNNHGNDTGIGNRHIELGIYGRPRGTEQGIRQSQTDEGQINDDEQKLKHGKNLRASLISWAAPHNSARSLRQDFCSNSKFRKWRNTVCISHFRNCGSGAKRRLRLADAIVRCCPCIIQPKRA